MSYADSIAKPPLLAVRAPSVFEQTWAHQVLTGDLLLTDGQPVGRGWNNSADGRANHFS
jgi:hypothetical protein